MALPAWLANVPAPDSETATVLRASTSNWMKLNNSVMTMSRLQVEQLLVIEVQGPCRPFYLHRLMTRVLRLRSDEDREALMRELPKPVVDEVNRLSAMRSTYRARSQP